MEEKASSKPLGEAEENREKRHLKVKVRNNEWPGQVFEIAAFVQLVVANNPFRRWVPAIFIHPRQIKSHHIACSHLNELASDDGPARQNGTAAQPLLRQVLQINQSAHP